jgi:hypothetical protein
MSYCGYWHERLKSVKRSDKFLVEASRILRVYLAAREMGIKVTARKVSRLMYQFTRIR